MRITPGRRSPTHRPTSSLARPCRRPRRLQPSAARCSCWRSDFRCWTRERRRPSVPRSSPSTRTPPATGASRSLAPVARQPWTSRRRGRRPDRLRCRAVPQREHRRAGRRDHRRRREGRAVGRLDGTSVRRIELSDGYAPEFVELSADGARALVALTADAVWRGAPVALLVDVEERDVRRARPRRGQLVARGHHCRGIQCRHRRRGPRHQHGRRHAVRGRLRGSVWDRAAPRKVSTLTFAADRIVTTSVDGRVWVAEGDTGTEVRSRAGRGPPRGREPRPGRRGGGRGHGRRLGDRAPARRRRAAARLQEKVTRVLTDKECAQFSHDVC